MSQAYNEKFLFDDLGLCRCCGCKASVDHHAPGCPIDFLLDMSYRAECKISHDIPSAIGVGHTLEEAVRIMYRGYKDMQMYDYHHDDRNLTLGLYGNIGVTPLSEELERLIRQDEETYKEAERQRTTLRLRNKRDQDVAILKRHQDRYTDTGYEQALADIKNNPEYAGLPALDA